MEKDWAPPTSKEIADWITRMDTAKKELLELEKKGNQSTYEEWDSVSDLIQDISSDILDIIEEDDLGDDDDEEDDLEDDDDDDLEEDDD